jgi:hypothetical protein
MRVYENALKSLALLASNMWHALTGQGRAARGNLRVGLPSEAATYWQRYADGDSDIWFAALVEQLDTRQPNRNMDDVLPSAKAFVNQCLSVEITLNELGAPTYLAEALDNGLMKDLRERLRQLYR